MTEHCTGLPTPLRESASDTPARRMRHPACNKTRPGTSRSKTNCRKIQQTTTDLSARLAEHEKGQGARLLQVVEAAGITWRLARTWPGGRDRERQLKKQGGARRRCPECGVKPRTPPTEPKDTPGMKQPARDSSPPSGTRPPEYVVEAWVSQQLRDRIQRTGATPAEAGRSADRQPQALTSPQLEDREAEP